ncbi:type IV pilin [Natronomonas gomsonensis]|uniref:DUF7289 family protein n=1 Tax=Natronomonas gomsonensis TaxID=1046043 RepID=UPI0015C0458C|nr:type IV pilin [Natronomonas gomsonensis]
MTASDRGQSNVVGVALLLGIAVVSMGTLTAAVGVVVDSSAAEADAERVATDLDDALEPVAATGPQRGTVTFSKGRLTSIDRTVTIRADGREVETVPVDALVFESGDRQVRFHAGAIVRGTGRQAWLHAPPPFTVDEDVLIVGAPTVGDDVGTISGSGGVTATVESDVSHERRDLGEATFSVAVETATPTVWERWFRKQGATVEREDGKPPVVVGTFEGRRTGYLVVHDLDAEVTAGG